MTDTIEQLRDELQLALRRLDEAAGAVVIPDYDNDLPGAVAHLRDEHKVPVHAVEETLPAALKAMHILAHLRLVDALEEQLGFAQLDVDVDPDSDVPADYDGEPSPDMDPAYEEFCERESHLCRADFLTGPAHDPYSTSCDHGEGHYPYSSHEGDDPFGTGGRVSWRGGGSCAGDPLRQTDIVWTIPERTEQA